MAWEAALAADVEHMPLTIHTVCGRLAVAAAIFSAQHFTSMCSLSVTFPSAPAMEN